MTPEEKREAFEMLCPHEFSEELVEQCEEYNERTFEARRYAFYAVLSGGLAGVMLHEGVHNHNGCFDDLFFYTTMSALSGVVSASSTLAAVTENNMRKCAELVIAQLRAGKRGFLLDSALRDYNIPL